MDAGPVKTEPVNGSPLPQRNPKGIQGQGGQGGGQPLGMGQQNQNQDDDMGIPEKKPRFNNPGGNQGGGGGPRGQNRGGNRFGGQQGGGNRNNNMRNRGRDGGNDGQGGGNRDRNDDRRGGGGNRGDGGGRKGDDYMVNQKLKNLSGPTHELPPLEVEETKFSGRNRLYIGNLTNDITEEELRELFKPYGEISEAFINAEKNFAFLKVDYHVNAEKAKRELDGQMRKNRPLRIRFAPNATVVRVKNLTPMVSNELLFRAFEVFGPVERAVIVVDDRGKSTGEGIVEFARKPGAMIAMRYCSEKCYFLTSALRPCVVEPEDMQDDNDGLPDKSMNKKTQEFYKERNVGPRFAEIGSFEHEYGTRWKQLHELFKQKHEALKRELKMEEEKLEAQMEFARYEHETEMLREQLRKREQDRERQKIEWELRERQVEELRNRDEEQMRRQQEDMQVRMNKQDDELRRRQQENTLFMQAQQLNSLLDQQEIKQGGGGGGGGGNMNRNQDRNVNFGGNNMGGGNQDQPFNPFEIPPNKPSGLFDDQMQGGGGGQGGGNNQGGQMNQRAGGGNQGGGNRPWNDRRGGGGDFQKRRRF